MENRRKLFLSLLLDIHAWARNLFKHGIARTRGRWRRKFSISQQRTSTMPVSSAAWYWWLLITMTG